MGCQTWPDSDDFKVCPQCGDATRRYRGVQPLSLEEAESVVKHIDFELYYDNWCARNNVPHD